MTPEQLKNEIDSYKDTVWMMLALIHELGWDDNARATRTDVKHEHGNKQQRSGSNDPVTPDVAMIVPVDGVMGEAKIGFSPKVREPTRDQVLKYDDALSVWIADGRVTTGSTILLTHHSRKVDAADFFEAETKAGRFQPKNAFAIIGGVRNSQAAEFISIERQYGRLANASKDEKLRKVLLIKLEHLVQGYGNIYFYDGEPPLLYLMQVIWDFILPSLQKETAFLNARPEPEDTGDGSGDGSPAISGGTKKAKKTPSGIEIRVSMDEVADRLRDFYSMKVLNPGLPESPRRSLVREALDHFVEYKLAISAGDRYVITYRKLQKGTLEYLLKKFAPPKSTGKGARAAPGQMPLFKERKRVRIEATKPVAQAPTPAPALAKSTTGPPGSLSSEEEE
jgi:hypothetical protein